MLLCFDSDCCSLAFTLGLVYAEDIPETDLVMGFENYAQMPNSVRGLLGVEAPTQDPFAPLDNERVQVGKDSQKPCGLLPIFRRAYSKSWLCKSQDIVEVAEYEIQF